MIFTPLPLDGAYVIDLEPRQDNRGFFARSFCAETFAAHGLENCIVQANTSYNRHRGTLRGLHFQRSPAAETKMVRCMRGAVHDVIVDLRAGSSTYGQWAGVDISEDNRRMIYVPRGFAHGFQSLTDDAELLYWTDMAYAAAHEGGLHYADPEVAIQWPLPTTQISERDLNLPGLSSLEPILL